MRRLLGSAVVLLLVPALVAPAWAAGKKDKKDEQSDEEVDLGDDTTTSPDDFKEEGNEAEEVPTRLTEDDAEEADPDNLDFEEGDDVPINFEDDTTQETITERGAGEDTAQIYRDAQKKYGDMTPDEEILRWEQYLNKYPKSLFRERIEVRMDELGNLMFSERVEGSDRGEKPMDAALRELNFAVPQRFSPVDPRTKITAGFEMGIPNWFGLDADFEYQFMRQASAHAGIKRGFSGWELGLGGRYAIIKSARTRTILSAGLDLNLNAAPTFLALKPMVNFGQRFEFLDGLDVQAEFSPVIELYAPAGLKYAYGVSGQLQINPVVAIFVETTHNLKYLSEPDVDAFYYMVGTFGLKFTPIQGKGENKDGRVVVDLAGNIPYAFDYWSFYQGQLQVGVGYYF